MLLVSFLDLLKTQASAYIIFDIKVLNICVFLCNSLLTLQLDHHVYKSKIILYTLKHCENSTLLRYFTLWITVNRAQIFMTTNRLLVFAAAAEVCIDTTPFETQSCVAEPSPC